MKSHHLESPSAFLWNAALVGLISVLGTACTTPRPGLPSTATPVAKNFLITEYSADKEVEEAQNLIESGDYFGAIPRLIQTVNKYPRSKGAVDARFFLGVAYYEIESYKDAQTTFEDYLRLAPEGKHAQQSRDYIARLNKEYAQKYMTAERADTLVRELSAKIQSDPVDLKLRYDLADVHWQRGAYDEAAAIYRDLIAKTPEYARDQTISKRMERLPSGEYVALTPSEVMRREVEAHPLQVLNVNSFRSGRDFFNRTSQYYVVTGQVLNRGDSTLYGVQVSVTIYGLGNIVYDTNVFNIGRLNPKEMRAFSVRFSDFDEIDNVFRHECVAAFQR